MVEQKFSRLKFLTSTGLIMIGASLKLKGLNISERRHEKIIDIHQHVHYVGRTNEQLIAHQRAMGVTKTILLPAGSPENTASTLYGEGNGLQADAWGNESCYELAQKYPKEFLFGANEVPDLANAIQEIEKYLKMGEWNTYKIKADGDEVTTWLNGHQMCYIKDEKIGQGEGFIALQIHQGGGIKVSWKNIKIQELK